MFSKIHKETSTNPGGETRRRSVWTGEPRAIGWNVGSGALVSQPTMELKTIRQKVKGLVGEDRGVSPVIGVILMVAITVILAAVIGAFVLGPGDDLGKSAGPQASISASVDGGVVVFTHNGGDSTEEGNLRLGDGTDATVDSGSTFSAGTQITTAEDGTSTVRLVYDDGDTSSVIATYEP